MIKKVSIAQVKNYFSEYLAKVMYSHQKLIITKRGKPVAAIVNIEDLNTINSKEETEGLASIIGKWKHFEEISNNVEFIYKSRSKDKLRNVSF